MALSWLVQSDSPDSNTHAEAFLAEDGWTVRAVTQRLLPVRTLGLDGPLPHGLSWQGWTAFRPEVDLAVTKRLSTLTRHGASQESERRTLTQSFAASVDARVRQRVTSGMPADSFVAHLHDSLTQEAQQAVVALEGLAEAQQVLDEEQGEVAARLDELVAKLPDGWRAWLALLWRPHRWWGTWQRWRAWRVARAAYLTCANRRLTLRVALLRGQLVGAFLAEAVRHVERWQRRLGELRGAVQAASVALQSRIDGQDAVFGAARDDDVWRWDVVDSALAQQWLDEAVAELPQGWSMVKPDAAEPELPDGAAPKPAGGAVPASVEALLLDAARGRLGWVRERGVMEVLAQVTPDPEARHERVEALLSAAIPFWQQDELSAGSADAPLQLVGVPLASATEVATWLEQREPAPRVVPLDDTQQIVALQLRRITDGLDFESWQGVPADSLMEETS